MLLIAGLIVAPPALSRSEPPVPPAMIRLAQAAVSADQAATIARNRTGGRVLGVDWSDRGGQPVYLVKVLMPDGSIRVVTVAASGG